MTTVILDIVNDEEVIPDKDYDMEDEPDEDIWDEAPDEKCTVHDCLSNDYLVVTFPKKFSSLLQK